MPPPETQTRLTPAVDTGGASPYHGLAMASPHRRRWLRFAAVAGGLLALLALDYGLALFLIRTPPTDWPPYRIPYDHAAHFVGDGFHLMLLGGGLWLAGHVAWDRRVELAGKWMVASMLLVGFWTHTLKLLIGRPRPRGFVFEGFWAPIGPHLLPASFDSFPSGHSMAVFALLPLLIALLPRFRKLLLGVGVFVALGRVYGGNHFLSDILAGGLIGWSIGSYTRGRWRAEVADEAA